MADDEDRDEAPDPEKAHRRRFGILSFVAFLGGIAVLVLVAWGVGWDQFLADRDNPEADDV